MLDAKEFISHINKHGINSFYGVPDSLLKPFCNEVLNLSDSNHQITTNEGMAIALAIGNHFSYLGRSPIEILYNFNVNGRFDFGVWITWISIINSRMVHNKNRV